ncbi:MAG TPA: ABC transporter permease [Acidimicrobiia bacterium]|nr:ABC transporter permease [Acidimicrobiia bacterium]
MGRFLVRRIISSIITLFFFASLVFFVAKVMMPGDFTNNFMPGLGERRAAMQAELGLDRSVFEQWWRFMGSFVQGRFGETTDGRPILDLMATLLPWSLLIFTLSVTLAFLSGHWLGKVVGWSKSRRLKGIIRLGAVTTHTLFPPFLAFLLAIAWIRLAGLDGRSAMTTLENVDQGGFRVGRAFMILPTSGEPLLWQMSIAFIVTGIVILTIQKPFRRLFRKRIPGWFLFISWVGLNFAFWQYLGERAKALDILFLLSLPLMAVAILTVGEIILVVEAAMDGVSQEEYIHTARAIGMSEKQVRDRHAARVALLPALSRFVVSLPFVLSGLVIVEYAFSVPTHYGASINFPGLSSVLFASLQARDYPLVVGGLLFIGLISVGARIVLDVLHAMLDPRTRYGQTDRPTEMAI